MTPTEVIARTLYAENRNHGIDGIRLVADSIWNRARKHSRDVLWATVLVNVCLAHKQFSCWNDGKLWTAAIPECGPDRIAWDQCIVIAQDVLSGFYQPDGQHTHYCNADCFPAWAPSMEFLGEKCGMKTYREKT